jgi:hypothetical protein
MKTARTQVIALASKKKLSTCPESARPFVITMKADKNGDL